MKMYQVDAFTKELFRGNPAAVIVEKEWLDADLMQKIAFENNLSETAFVKIIDAENYEIRWFTPAVEADFCGHATLASAFVLFKNFTDKKTINFHVRNLGLFIVHQDDDGKIRMNFPIRKAHQVEDYPAVLREALTKPFKAVYQNVQAYIVEYESVQDVLDEQPDMSLLKTLGKRTAITTTGMEVAITSKTDQQYDCVSRYFAPVAGINEDPVTGSIHTAIAPLWAEKLGKNNITAYQASSRGGVLYCNILSEERIEISGYGKLYMQAEIFL
ncbi:PhzF family phenazine biosynthesis protein [Acinetobacter oleivorans]|uniref:PhzF family phenazine biosynthesis protein n=1 Tax=Acinetobacter oleivorans TaxID=1148157 RepID=UPI001580E76B|nr:PhzF family phenazine biosynthesis protein [Acinetobacter oleivorans]NUF22112.1 PhzF family phenazine biosynthesis protein [Acinetobacter oleivorans]